jgi:hypothetical protein
MSSDGAPILSVEIQCPPIVTLDESLYVTVIVKSHPSLTGADERPILFHIIATLGGTLYRKHGDEWEACEDEEMGFAIYDDPDVEICPCRHEDFVFLRPGETWTRRDYVQLPHDTKAGDVFKYLYKGGYVDWWDWGIKDDHADTKVVVRCWITTNVVKPKDNEGRPIIVVPASNVVVFTKA